VPKDSIMRGKLLASFLSFALWATFPTLASAAEPVAPTPMPLVATANNDEAQSNLLQQKLAELDRLQGEVAELREATGTPHSIYVSVEVLEVSLTKMRELGVDFSSSPGEMILAGSWGGRHQGSGAYTAPGEVSEHGEAIVPQSKDESTPSFIDALIQNNVARVLANPCVMMVSGEPATLFVGEQFPLPRTAPDAPVEFQEAGIRHDVLAESLGNSRVRLHIRPRISTAGPPEFEVDGLPVRSLRVQQCELSCETTFGETVAMCGLVTERTEAIIQDGGRVTEKPIEIALWVVVRAEDASNVPQRETRVQNATYVAPQ
jgi:Flp pilus assembly secretin CpaC